MQLSTLILFHFNIMNKINNFLTIYKNFMMNKWNKIVKKLVSDPKKIIKKCKFIKFIYYYISFH